MRIAHSAEEALGVLDVSPVRVLVVDVLLPGMSGFDLVRRLKPESSLQGIAAIAVSVIGGPQAERQAMESGCARFIQKPLDLDEFLQVVTGVVRDLIR